MNRILAAALAVALPSLASAAGPSSQRIRVAIMEVRPLSTDPQQAELLSEVALTEAAGMRRFEVIGRSDVAAILGLEKQKAMLGCAEDSNCLAEIGGALGVQYMVVGSFGKIGSLFRLDLKLVDAKRARVLERFGRSVEGREETLVAATQAGIRTLLETIPAPLPLAEKGAPLAEAAPPRADLEPSPPRADPVAAPVPTDAPPARRGSTRRTLGWVSGGAGVAALAVGGLFGVKAKRSYDAADAATDLETFDAKKADARRQSVVADVLFGVGAVGAGIGGWLLFTGRHEVTAAAAPVPGGAVAVVEGRF